MVEVLGRTSLYENIGFICKYPVGSHFLNVVVASKSLMPLTYLFGKYLNILEEQ